MPSRSLRVVYVMLDAPRPVTSGYAQHCESMAQALRDVVDLRILALQSSTAGDARKRTLEAYAGDVITPVPRGRLWRLGRHLLCLVTGRNRWLSKYLDDPAFPAAREAIRRFDPDLVVAGHTALTGIGDALGIPFHRMIVEHHDPASVNFRDRAAVIGGLRRWQFLADAAMMRRAEWRCAGAFDQWAVSEEDAGVITGLTGHRPTVIPNCISDAFFEPPGEVASDGDGLPVLGFLGAYGYDPNVEAAHRALAISGHLSRAGVAHRLQLVGGGAPPSLQAAAAACPEAEMTGFVADLAPVLRHWTIMLAPMATGSGTKVKVLQAFAMGIPVVTTPIGAQGMPIRDRGLGLVAETDEDLARACRRLLDDPAERSACAARARAWAWDNVSETALRRRLEAVFAGYGERLG